MGYGNPLFDGDVPLPAMRRTPRVLSMQLWVGALLAGTLGEGVNPPDRHEDDAAGNRDTGQWPQESREGRDHR